MVHHGAAHGVASPDLPPRLRPRGGRRRRGGLGFRQPALGALHRWPWGVGVCVFGQGPHTARCGSRGLFSLYRRKYPRGSKSSATAGGVAPNSGDFGSRRCSTPDSSDRRKGRATLPRFDPIRLDVVRRVRPACCPPHPLISSVLALFPAIATPARTRTPRRDGMVERTVRSRSVPPCVATASVAT